MFETYLGWVVQRQNHHMVLHCPPHKYGIFFKIQMGCAYQGFTLMGVPSDSGSVVAPTAIGGDHSLTRLSSRTARTR